MLRLFAALVVALVAFQPSATMAEEAAETQTRALSDFYGLYRGAGTIFDESGRPSHRNSTVEIKEEGNGFALAWNTFIGKEPKVDGESRFQLKGTERIFKAANDAGRYDLADDGDPLNGGTACWAHVNGNTLVVTELVVGEDGTYDLTRYERTLNADGKKMEVVFTRLQEGKMVRTAELELERQ